MSIERSLSPGWMERLTIHADGTFTYSATFNGLSTEGKGTWSAQDSVVVFSGSTKQFAFNVDGTTMTFSGTVPEGAYALKWSKQ